MPELSKKQLEFFAWLILICTVTAIIVLAIDYQIKGAILEQSNALRREIEAWRSGQSTAPTDGNRSDNHAGNDPAFPADLVDSGATGVETPSDNHVGNGASPATASRAAKSRSANGRGRVQGASE